MRTVVFRSEDILESIERHGCFDNFFPIGFAYARARLTAFRDSDEWIVALEVIGYETKGGFVSNIMSACGNKLTRKNRRDGGLIEDLLRKGSRTKPRWDWSIALLPSPASKDYPYFEEDENGIALNPFDFTVSVRGYVRRYVLTREDYAAQGIDISRQISNPGIDALVKITRYLCFAQPESMFHAPAEILSRLGRNEAIPVFMQVYGWRHPDFRRKERVRDSQCLTKLADALAANDRSLYVCPEEIWNTHWSLWPEWPD